MTELPDRLLRDALDHTASTSPSTTCVDVERLAAWADGTMTNAERTAIEAHAAVCARCLALLAAMTRTAPPPIAAPWWRRSPMAWLLPLAAVTAGLVIVVRLAVLEQRSVGSPAAAVPAAAAPAAAAPPTGNIPQAAPAPAQPPAASLASEAPGPARQTQREPLAAKAERAARPPTETMAKVTAVPTGRGAPTPRGVSTQPVAPSQPVAAPPAAAPAAAPVAASTPAPPPSAQQLATSAVGGLVAAGRGGAGGDRAVAARSAVKADATAPAVVVIASPDRDSQWRIVSGKVERTADGGATWQPQMIGVVTPVRAGAAPTARVCWLAGAGGVVLRTTDRTTWTRIPFPEPADLVALQASDASHATVTTADGRRFTTSDGGATWTPQ